MNLNSSSIDDRNALLERRNSLINLSRATLTNFNNINKYEISVEKQQYLENENIELLYQYNKLESINEKLNKINKEQIYNVIADTGNFISVSEILKQQGDYLTPNDKIVRIEAVMDDDYIYTCNWYHANGYVARFSLVNEHYGLTIPINAETRKINITEDEFVEAYDYYSTDTLNCAFVIKTSKNRTIELIPKNMSINESDYPSSKEFRLELDLDTWENHYQKYHGVNGYFMASITTEAENELVKNLVNEVKNSPEFKNDGHNPFYKIYLGGGRTSAGQELSRARDTTDSTWYWLDGSEWNDFNGSNFNSRINEPGGTATSWRPAGNYITMTTTYSSYDGKWNGDKGISRRPVLLSKTVNNKLNKITVGPAPKGYQVVYYQPAIIRKYNINKTAVDEAEKLLDILYEYKSQIENLDDYINTLSNNNINMMSIIMNQYYENLDDINKIKTLNNLEGFENKEQPIINKISNILYDIYNNISSMVNKDNKLIENMDNNNYTSPYYDKRKENVNKTISSINEELHLTDKFEYDQNRNFLLELGSQNNNLFSNVFMDYMINNETNSSIEDIYEKKKQEKSDTIRKININNFKYKTINEYGNIIKFTIVCSILMILFLLLNRFRLISKNLALALIIALLITIVLFILYSSYNLHIKDKYNFDKIDFPFDPNNFTSENNNDNTNNIDISMNLGCLAQECCGENMTFDVEDNKCKPKYYVYPGHPYAASYTGFANKPAEGNSIYECLEKIGSKYSVVGHRNENAQYPNTCYAWLNNPPEDVKITTTNGTYPNKFPLPDGADDGVHTTACSNGKKIPDLCK